MDRYSSLRRQIDEKGRRTGFRYSAGYMTRHRDTGTTLEGVRAIKVENNTYAWLDGEDIVIRFIRTDLVRLRRDGLQIIEAAHDSQTSRSRYNNYIDGWRIWSWNNEPVANKYFSSFGGEVAVVLPVMRGMVLGNWSPSGEEQALILAARLGNGDACRRLAGKLEHDRGEPFDGMARAFEERINRDGTCTPWAVKGRKRALQHALEEKMEHAVAETKGLWLVNDHTGEMFRALMPEDIVLRGIEPVEGNVVWLDNVKYTLENGAEYGARPAIVLGSDYKENPLRVSANAIGTTLVVASAVATIAQISVDDQKAKRIIATGSYVVGGTGAGILVGNIWRRPILGAAIGAAAGIGTAIYLARRAS
jgi:hypothetical protein